MICLSTLDLLGLLVDSTVLLDTRVCILLGPWCYLAMVRYPYDSTKVVYYPWSSIEVYSPESTSSVLYSAVDSSLLLCFILCMAKGFITPLAYSLGMAPKSMC